MIKVKYINTVTTFCYGTGIDEILVMQQTTAQSTATYYYHANALGSVVAVTNQTGTVSERYEYNGFGAVSMYNASYNPIEYSAIGNTYMFTGREYEAESGLYYYRARHYSATLGRFLQRDPIGIWEDETNLGNGYSYVGNNAINKLDPFGLVAGSNWYGNWCGPGGSGPVIDEIDGCCKAHDECWEQYGASGLSGWFEDTGSCNKEVVKCVWNAVKKKLFGMNAPQEQPSPEEINTILMQYSKCSK